VLTVMKTIIVKNHGLRPLPTTIRLFLTDGIILSPDSP
jgi:hypothetical protein